MFGFKSVRFIFFLPFFLLFSIVILVCAIFYFPAIYIIPAVWYDCLNNIFSKDYSSLVDYYCNRFKELGG